MEGLTRRARTKLGFLIPEGVTHRGYFVVSVEVSKPSDSQDFYEYSLCLP